MILNNSKIALVHDWFLKSSFGGAEKVTLLLDKYLTDNYSTPDLHALAENIKDFKDNFLDKREINTSFIQSLPFGKSNVQKYLPLLPFAIEQFDLSKYDLIISSSHAVSKGVLTSPDQLHISYVHTPMRYAWDQMNTYIDKSNLAKFGFELPLRYFLYKLREWDFSSSQRIDYLISNSNFTARRIKKYWGLNSEVIHPPVDVERFEYKKTRGDFYLSVNRIVPNKRIDLLVNAFNKLGLPLIIIGDGPERNSLEKIAKPNIKFLKKLPNSAVENYMARCRAFVYAGLEDFGIAPVEAMAAGSPVIAFGRGGVLDTINCCYSSNKDKISNGILFRNQTSSDLVDSINFFEDKKMWRHFDSEALNNYAQKFNTKVFTSKFDFFINNAWSNFKNNS